MAPSPRRFDPRTLDLAVGGQAVIEGVMMRGLSGVATAVRTPDGGIVVRRLPFVSVVRRHPLLNLPLLRGAIVLIETMALGLRSLMYSAEQAVHEEAVEDREVSLRERLVLWGTLGVTLILGLALFFYLPLVLADLLGARSGLAFNLLDGALRLALFLGYLLLISRMKDIQRVFQYHGAEHKSIHVFEHGLPLRPESAHRFTTFHPRCGTSFLFFVMVVSILVFLTLGRPESIGDRLERLAFIPLIGGIAYEVIKLSGRFQDRWWIRPLIQPGLWLQRITTREPSDEQVEVAMAALAAVLEEEAIDFAEETYLQLAGTSS